MYVFICIYTYIPLNLCMATSHSCPACCSSQPPTRPAPSATTRLEARSAAPQLAGPAYHVHVDMHLYQRIYV